MLQNGSTPLRCFLADSFSERAQDHHLHQEHTNRRDEAIKLIAACRRRLKRLGFLESSLLWTSDCPQILMRACVASLVQPGPVAIDNLQLFVPNEV